MELYGFMEREKKIPSYFFIITKQLYKKHVSLSFLIQDMLFRCKNRNKY